LCLPKSGTYTWKNGNKYIGQWSNGNMNGYGVCIYDVSKYIGKFSNADRNDYGILIITNQDKIVVNCSNAKYYVGGWKQGNKSGIGTCYNSDGKLIYYGKFENDKPIETYPTEGCSNYKYQKITYTSGDWYEGETKDGKRDGYGVYYWKNGSFWYGK
jgi:hypothetical protein